MVSCVWQHSLDAICDIDREVKASIVYGPLSDGQEM